jgi:predicted nucleic acid-binding protein
VIVPRAPASRYRNTSAACSRSRITTIGRGRDRARPYELLAPRAWQLRHDLSSYDAGYVALAELTSTTLVTLDRRLAAAPGLHCPVRTP